MSVSSVFQRQRDELVQGHRTKCHCLRVYSVPCIVLAASSFDLHRSGL